MDYELRKVRERLGEEHELELELTTEAKDFLIDKGYNPDFGARPLRRAIEHHVEDPISEEILRGNYSGKKRIVVSVRTEGEGDSEDEEKHLYFEAAGEADSQSELEEVHEGT